jgi:hypothetical protein
MRALHILAIAGVVLAVLVPVANGGAPVGPTQPAGNQLWYRVNVSITGSYRLTSTEGTEVQTNAWSLHSNTAILLKRVCTIEGSPLSASRLATINGLGQSFSCAQLRRAVRGLPQARSFRARMQEDFSFNANATGTAEKWELTATTTAYPTVVNGKAAQCPGGSTHRIAGPIDITGRIAGSARNGLSAGFNTRDGWAPGTETRSYGECTDVATGEAVTRADHGTSSKPISAGVLGGEYDVVRGGGRGGEFGGALLLRAIKIRNVEHLFGRSFTVSGTQPGTYQFAANSGSSTKSVAYRIDFTLCPRGGRNVQGC